MRLSGVIDMVLWFIYFLLSLVFTALCYITNPIVVLFCDEDGELPGIFHLWQTWDNSCNPSDVKRIFPSWLQYDWDVHYREYEGETPYLHEVNRTRYFTECINSDFAFDELLKRYVCRVLWLTRNNAYGFCFYMLGLNVTPSQIVHESEHTMTVWEVFGDDLKGAWMYKNTAPIFKAFGYQVYWNNLLGWKIDTEAMFDTRAMLATRVAFKVKKEES